MSKTYKYGWIVSSNRKEIGPDIFIEDSFPENKNRSCGICDKKGTPIYIGVSNDLGTWICGSEECIQMYILSRI